jgi:hypothetical protein
MKCGRESGGRKADKLGTCPASIDSSTDGLNGGFNGGRICWAIAGTFCDGVVQGSFAEKKVICTVCEFYLKVQTEEGFVRFRMLKPEQLHQKQTGSART